MNCTYKRNAELSQSASISIITLRLVPTSVDCVSCFFVSPLEAIEFNDMKPRAEVAIAYFNRQERKVEFNTPLRLFCNSFYVLCFMAIF